MIDHWFQRTGPCTQCGWPTAHNPAPSSGMTQSASTGEGKEPHRTLRSVAVDGAEKKVAGGPATPRLMAPCRPRKEHMMRSLSVRDIQDEIAKLPGHAAILVEDEFGRKYDAVRFWAIGTATEDPGLIIKIESM